MTDLIARQTDDRKTLIQSVLDGLTSPHSRRAYDRALTAFLTWHTEQGQPPLTKAVVNAYKSHLVASGQGVAAINQSLSAIRKLVQEGADNGAIEPALAAGIARVKGIKNETLPAGRSISAGELTALLTGCANDPTPAGARDAAMLALLYAGGLRRAELVGLARADYDEATGELKILHAKGRKQRTAHLSGGARAALTDWLAVRGEAPGPLFVPIRRGGPSARAATDGAGGLPHPERAGQTGGGQGYQPARFPAHLCRGFTGRRGRYCDGAAHGRSRRYQYHRPLRPAGGRGQAQGGRAAACALSEAPGGGGGVRNLGKADFRRFRRPLAIL